MSSFNQHELVGEILRSGRQLVIAVTGGASGAVSALLQTPGASRAVLEAVAPYSFPALVDWLGGKPDQACSEATARAMAMAAFMRARRHAPKTEAGVLLGVGFTGSLATDRVKRGPRRFHMAAQTATRTEVHSVQLFDQASEQSQGEDPNSARRRDEDVTTSALLWLIARSACVPVASFSGGAANVWQAEVEEAPREIAELLMGARRAVVLKPGSSHEYLLDNDAPKLRLLFPGAFNPPHEGHWRMAEIAEQQVGAPAAWELSIANVDKPPLDFIAIRRRVEALRSVDKARLIVLTHAPTFRQKAELFPGAVFVVGVDTLVRIAEPRYYANDSGRRDEAIAVIARHGCRFLVFGRELDGRFVALGDLDLPPELRSLCDDVPASVFREDVSSTALRAHLAPGHCRIMQMLSRWSGR